MVRKLGRVEVEKVPCKLTCELSKVGELTLDVAEGIILNGGHLGSELVEKSGDLEDLGKAALRDSSEGAGACSYVSWQLAPLQEVKESIVIFAEFNEVVLQYLDLHKNLEDVESLSAFLIILVELRVDLDS